MSGRSKNGDREKAEGVTPSSGNVFADIGLPNPGLALAKANLAHRIAELIKQRKSTPTQAAEVLGLTQPKVSDLLRGQLQGFTLDRLLKLLNKLGQDVEISVRPALGDVSDADTRVTCHRTA